MFVFGEFGRFDFSVGFYLLDGVSRIILGFSFSCFEFTVELLVF